MFPPFHKLPVVLYFLFTKPYEKLHPFTWFLGAFYGGLTDSSVGKESICKAGDPSLIPGLRRSGWEGIGYALQSSWASLVAQLVKNQETWTRSLDWEDPWRRERLPTPVFWPGEFHGWLKSMGSQRDRTPLSDFQFQEHFIVHYSLLNGFFSFSLGL